MAGGLDGEVARLGHPVDRRERPRRLLAQDVAELVGGPDVEQPLDPLAVRVLGRVEPALGRRHVPQDVGEHLPGGLGVEPVAGGLVGLQIGQREHRLVVQHLLEVGHEPACVGGVAVEPVPQVVEQSTASHAPQGGLDHLQGRWIPRARPASQEERQLVGGGELGGAAEPAEGRIEVPREVLLGQIEHRRLQRGALAHVVHLLEEPGDLLRRRQNALAVISPGPVDGGQELHHARPAVDPVLGDVGAREEGTPLGGQHHGQRPAARAGHHLGHGHVDRVDVRTLLPVDLDADEAVVQQRGHLRILEGLVLHHVAPVAGGITDGQEHRAVQLPGALEGLVPPGVPVDRVAGVLEQVGALFVDQAVELRAPVEGKGIDDRLRWNRRLHGSLPGRLRGRRQGQQGEGGGDRRDDRGSDHPRQVFHNATSICLHYICLAWLQV